MKGIEMDEADSPDGRFNVLGYSAERAKEHLPLPFRTGMGVISSQIVTDVDVFRGRWANISGVFGEK